MFSYLHIPNTNISMFSSSKNIYTETPWNISSLNEGNASYSENLSLRTKGIVWKKFFFTYDSTQFSLYFKFPSKQAGRKL